MHLPITLVIKIFVIELFITITFIIIIYLLIEAKQCFCILIKSINY